LTHTKNHHHHQSINVPAAPAAGTLICAPAQAFLIYRMIDILLPFLY
jgi:hypothetical protein